MNVYSSTFETLQRDANSVFCNAVLGMNKEGFLTNEQVDILLRDYSVIVESSGWLSKALARYLGIGDDKLLYRLVKAVNRIDADA
jgi:hypothetical protein